MALNQAQGHEALKKEEKKDSFNQRQNKKSVQFTEEYGDENIYKFQSSIETPKKRASKKINETFNLGDKE